ncbi:MAG: hypothetical protein JW881_00930 [Spirochaetales bacterium]|nr:hypothetical protein [Spirochaetales bacterium]
MGELKYQFDTLSTREGFNQSLRHFKLVLEIINDFEKNYNLADIMNELITAKRIIPTQIKPIIFSLLVDKYGYAYSSYNVEDSIEKFDAFVDEVSKWKAVDIVLAYFHPELDVVPINPKNPAHFEAVRTLKKNELVTIFVGEFKKTEKKKFYDEVIESIKKLLKGKTLKAPPSFKKGSYTFKKYRKIEEIEEAEAPPQRAPKIKKTTRSTYKPEQKQAVQKTAAEQVQQKEGPPKRMRMTPMYGIIVTNELFHNGNVEAWKKIITSYEHTYTQNRVLVFYDGERINDINTLFKWGKVKRGTAIMISVVGEAIADVAKLKRYLMQGASHRFEDFLHGPPNQILKLF